MRKLFKFVCFMMLCAGLMVQGVCAEGNDAYKVGVDDVLEISIIQPETYMTSVTVAPDGRISFPYVGTVYVKGRTLDEIKDSLESALSDGYMEYPVLTVFLKESLSRKFFVYGEVIKPGTYRLHESTTVLKAITIAGGFTRFGSSSKVKILREKEDGPGYENFLVNIKDVMNGDDSKDIILQPNDIVVVSEGVF